ncbi:MAG: hypothetical protein HFE63_03965 [Clostridiales bacterium]|nr:hypothetical protein [Clostridiales bacterium]
MKKTLFSKLIAISLLGSMSLTLGCGQTPDDDTIDTDSTSGDTTDANVETDIYADLPTGDYGGEVFSILNNSFTYAEYRLDAESVNGDVLNDAVYERTRKVEELLNIEIQVTNMDFWAEDACSVISNAVMAGEYAYDACFLGAMNNVSAIMKGTYIDLNTLDFDFDKPWWSLDSARYYNIDGKLFMIHSEASANIHDSMWVNYFNKKIAEDEKLGDMYELVHSGKWTLDKMYELVEATTHDLNGDGQMKIEDDQFGLLTHTGSTYGFLHGGGEAGIDIKDGMPSVLDISERKFDVITKIKRFLHFDGTILNDSVAKQGFKDGKGFLHVEVLGNAALMRDMDVDFGILPYPKYDENQENYISYYSPGTNAMSIPKTVENVQRAIDVMEVMSAYGYQMIRPKYYDLVLNGKTVRDEESKDMLDIIFSNIESEMAFIYKWGGYNDVLLKVITTDVDVVSTLEGARASCEAGIDSYLKAIN